MLCVLAVLMVKLYILIQKSQQFFASFLIRIQLNQNEITPKYFIQFSQSSFYWKQANTLVLGGGQPQFNANVLKEIVIPLPPLYVQNGITDLLSSWDLAIVIIEKLVAAKAIYFNWLLNSLIFNNINSNWKELKLGEIFKERKEPCNNHLPLLSITREEGVIKHADTNRKDTSNKDKTKYLRICKNDIGYNTMRMWQGVSAISSLEGIVSPAYTICIPQKDIDAEYASYLFKTTFMIHQFYCYSQGLTSDTWNLKYYHFSKIKTTIPPLKMQKNIAELLTDTKKEIELLKKISFKYQEQKRGLMQKLLTGTWHVNVVETVQKMR